MLFFGRFSNPKKQGMQIISSFVTNRILKKVTETFLVSFYLVDSKIQSEWQFHLNTKDGCDTHKKNKFRDGWGTREIKSLGCPRN